MPLVTITCSKSLYPPDDGGAGGMMSQAQEALVNFAEALPQMISESANDLGLDTTPEEGVQVDIRKFHRCAVNSVDIWVQVQFTEPYPGKSQAERVRETLVAMLFWKTESMRLEVQRAVDIFWGPSHGHLWLNSAHNIIW